MKNRNKWIVIIAFFVLLMMPSICLAAEVDVGYFNAQKYKVLTLIPPIVAIILAFLTRNVIASLFIGIISGSLLLTIPGNNIFYGIVDAFIDVINRMVTSLADTWNAGIILQVLAIGGLINLVTKMGGAKAIAESLSKRAKNRRSSQIITWLSGLIIFFDDYANAMIVGTMMRPITDKMKISREKLAFIVDATAAPVAGIAVISTWIGMELGLIKDAFSTIGVNADAFGVFVQTIPYRFYNILILFFIVISVLLLKDFGSMRKAEVKARKEGIISSGHGIDISDSNEGIKHLDQKGLKPSMSTAILPIGVLIVVALLSFYFSGYKNIIGGDSQALINLLKESPISFVAIRETFSASDASIALFQSSLLAGIVAIIMATTKKIFTFSEAIDIWMEGLKRLLITCVILVCAWSLSSVIKELGTAKYLITLLSDAIPPFLLPTIIFLLGAIISFATGTSYGTMGILMPLAIPLAYSMNLEMSFIIVSTSAVLTGAIFGDHCSPISDTTILSSMGAGCNHINHVKTQLPYALFTAVITIIFGYIPVGLGMSIYIVLPLSIIALFIGIQVLGKKVE
ncbi:Na+/H+ antiporter NhaC family protein [Romboutsia sp. Marseille-P6047]|uniref:Na+/H+ antiporter NhaC family protein n=1 Tax=Romboutsia sp. Marseille-P6047 TaxID=2161817 RepID=UPI000F05FD49|nr:Na+/H+ antiporter NhaC family protein [Romboutsia sp. Marseille-P6047]